MPYPRFGELALIQGSDYGWYLGRPLQFELAPGELREAPAGMPTDGASIPRAARVVFDVWGRAGRPAVMHDYLYRYGLTDRAAADRAFLAGLEAEGMGWWKRKTMYAAVRTGGWVVWRRYRRFAKS